MGCVWQSDYVPVPGVSQVKMNAGSAARHRKPPRWRRGVAAVAAVASALLAVPGRYGTGARRVAAATARSR